MKNLLLIIPALVFISATLVACDAPEDKTVDASIASQTAYAFATTPKAKTGAIFLTLKNDTDQEDSLIGVKSDLAEITEIHENLIDPDDGKMMMRRIREITIPANSSVDLTPTGYHIMLIKLKQPLKQGDQHSVTLEYKNKGTVEVDFIVTAPGKKPSRGGTQ